ncbi:hypothetical protein [Kibdelosporangium philippinense]
MVSRINVDLQAMRTREPNAVPPPGAAFGFSVKGGCVTGAVTPDAVSLSATGPIAEVGCNLMPFTH